MFFRCRWDAATGYGNPTLRQYRFPNEEDGLSEYKVIRCSFMAANNCTTKQRSVITLLSVWSLLPCSKKSNIIDSSFDLLEIHKISEPYAI